jgi:hypothetical protein
MEEPDSTSNTMDSIVGVVPPDAQEQLKSDANAVAGEAVQTFEAVKQEAAGQLAAVKDQAQGQIADATGKAKSFAAEQKDSAGDQLGSVADAISKVADELQGGEQAVAAGYAHDLAGGIRSVSQTIKSRNVDELIGMAEDFGRQQPLAFLGAAALAGFVASRFVLASAQRRSGSQPSASSPTDTGGAPLNPPTTAASAGRDF